MGALPARYSFVLNPHVRERFTKCPSCNSPTRLRKLPLVVHVGQLDGPRLVLLNKSCRLCVVCETLIVHRAELDFPSKETRVTVLLRPSEMGTALTLRMRNFESTQERDANRQAWEKGLSVLADVVQ
jgi:hypothetical protein